MKLVKQAKGNWQYQLAPKEADLLVKLVNGFPFCKLEPVKISKTDKDLKAKEREKLLNESLAEHRRELKKAALRLISSDKFKAVEKGLLMTLGEEERETLLQILNYIRVGCWQALGEPEEMHPPLPETDGEDYAYWFLMDLAGYFECGPIDLGD